MAHSKVIKTMIHNVKSSYTTENSYVYDIAFLSTDPPKYYTMHL